MASSRAVLQLGSGKKKTYKRMGKATASDKALVAQVVMDQPGEVSPQQVRALATTLKRTPAMIKALVADARERFVSRAGDYVDIHFNATQKASLSDDPKSLDVAVKASQWAIQNLSGEGARVVDKASTEPQGQRIFIGVRIGGVDASRQITSEVIDAEK